MVLEVGRVCMKITGREAGKFCVVIKKAEKSFVHVTGPRLLTDVKRRRVNISHIEPLNYVIGIKEGASDQEVIDALEKSGIVSKLNLKKPSAAQMKSEEKRKPAEPVEETRKKKSEKEKTAKKVEKQ